MSELIRTELTVPRLYRVSVADMLAEQVRVPVLPGGYIPVQVKNIRDRGVQFVAPEYDELGDNAMRLSLPGGEPFGFMWLVRNGTVEQRTPKTPRLELATTLGGQAWLAAVETETALDGTAKSLFESGVQAYTRSVDVMLLKRDPSNKFDDVGESTDLD